MKDILIYGASGFGKEVACLIDRINLIEPDWNIIGFIDDDESKLGHEVSRYGKVVGNRKTLKEWPSPVAVVVAIGNPQIMKKVTDEIKTYPHLSFPNIIHPSFGMADEETCHMGRGNIIQRGCFFSCDVTIGDFNVFNGMVVLGHDVRIGSHNIIMPAVRVSGAVTLGEGNLLGVSSIILQGIRIGNDVNLSAGSVLMKKPQDGMIYIGNPAKKFIY